MKQSHSSIQSFHSKQYTLLFRIIQWATICVFLGRAYQHWFWDAPFRSLLWDEEWMSSLVESWTSMTWNEYSTNLQVDESIQASIRAFGIFYFIGALVALFARKVPKILHYLLPIGAAALVFLAALYCKERFFSAGQFFEYSLQFGSPLILFYLLRKTDNWTNRNAIQATLLDSKFQLALKILIALTFTCHGLYALGYYPIPGGFMDMTINILGVPNDSAMLFLKIAGVLDFVLAILIFVPVRQLQMAALGYAIFWGFSTSIARVWAHFYKNFPIDSLHQWAHETLYRFPHFMIPLFLLLILVYQRKTINTLKDASN